jgi:3-methyladenine DNA glycosylase/8-oxoguanine DNA glycosylase
MHIGTLHPIPPYNFALSTRLARLHSVLDVFRDGEYWRALEIGGVVALVRVVSRGTTEAPQLDVYRMNASGPVDDTLLLARMAHLLGAEADMRPFYDHARHDPVLWPLVEPLYGLKHVRSASLFEALMVAIIEQQIALNLAQRGERWLLAWAGGRIDYDSETFYTFPRPERIAAASVEDLLPLKITRIRMEVMRMVAARIVSGAVDFDSLRTVDMAMQTLTQLRGVGQWTAAWATIRALGEYPYIGENDVALQAAINHYYFGQKGRVSTQVVRQTMLPYGEFAGAATFHILMQWGMAKYEA